MRVGELSRRSGVPLPTIKYYLREGLLPTGERTGVNQASYDDGHLHRLRLIRALLDVGGLSVAATRDVLAAVDEPALPLHHVLGTAHAGLTTTPAPDGDDEVAGRARARLDELIERRGWRVSTDNPARRTVVAVLATYEHLADDDLGAGLDHYADAVEELARHEVDTVVARGHREDVVEGVVVGTVLGDTLISALRRLAQEDASARRLS